MGTTGPYDVTEAPDDGVERLDLGALRIPVMPDVEIRVQAGEDGTVQQVVLVHGDNAVQLGVFAAPRSEGIWEETRAEIKSSLFDDGVAAEEVPGEYGTELRARVRTPEGLSDLRFVGIDGPRWLVRAIYQGKVAVDPAVAAPLVDCLRNVIVDRGKEAMPVREALPLRLPREAVEHVQAQQEAAATTPVPPANGTAPGAPRPTPRPAPKRRPSPRPRRG
ncbi:MAG: hypothetical protein AUG44_16955 [Actinobacteria bacterium 13_1_20CM_3_71_11]|nr:MAG: hypothetical protein AUG44_16955 [Actinobacteria bacterium 13_1_20CM_3_71_11]